MLCGECSIESREGAERGMMMTEGLDDLIMSRSAGSFVQTESDISTVTQPSLLPPGGYLANSRDFVPLPAFQYSSFTIPNTRAPSTAASNSLIPQGISYNNLASGSDVPRSINAPFLSSQRSPSEVARSTRQPSSYPASGTASTAPGSPAPSSHGNVPSASGGGANIDMSLFNGFDISPVNSLPENRRVKLLERMTTAAKKAMRTPGYILPNKCTSRKKCVNPITPGYTQCVACLVKYEGGQEHRVTNQLCLRCGGDRAEGDAKYCQKHRGQVQGYTSLRTERSREKREEGN
ncbi:hypothetical protein QBC43DRAFT_337943 [Cladorrhinum sp. PSN259]|nr:hypothetical protein QBC43DRAFT_337943 [Cladorrhinum sp. PSN259]